MIVGDLVFSVGLMSGTSLDGIDAVLVEINGQGIDVDVKVLEFITLDLSKEIKEEIKMAVSLDMSNSALICSLNFKLGYLFADAVKKVCQKAKFDISKLDFIASHGQTIYHIPRDDNKYIKSTLQIGEPAVIAYETGIKVVSNFRTMDMASGGEGAPLVPYTEYLLYSKFNKNLLLQNIGGIGNVTYIPKNKNLLEVFAFDTGPGNMIIDELVLRLFNKKYDENGNLARQGIVNETLLMEFINHDFIYKTPPKTTGREEFGEDYVRYILNKYSYIDKYDLIATATMFTAKSIAINYEKFIFSKVSPELVLLGGGGAHNLTLIDYLKKLINIEVKTQTEFGFDSDAKEAIAFCILGNETLHSKFSNLKNVTGAKQNVILGNITPSPFESR